MFKQLLILIIFHSLLCAGAEYFKVVDVEKNDTLSVRKAPSSKSKKIAELMPYDTGLDFDECKMNGRTRWCKVTFVGEDYMMFERGLTNAGWVNRKYLDFADNLIYSDGIPYGENRNIFKVVHVNAYDRLNVREHPYSDAKKVGILYANDVGIVARKCQRVGKSNWCYVAYDFTMGWAMGPGSTKVPYAVMGWVNMRYLKLDNSGAKSRLPGMTFKGEVF